MDEWIIERPRYVCLCNFVNENEIVDCIHNKGCTTFKQISETTQAATGCGGCTRTILTILERELKSIT